MTQHAGNDDDEFGHEIAYEVQYQDAERDDWFVFTNHRYEHRTPGTAYDETTDFAEALAAAQDLLTGAQVTDPRPKYQVKIVRTRIVQRTHIGTLLLTLGE